MTRLAIGIVIGMGLAVVGMAAIQSHAEPEPTDETIAVAAEAGVDELQLQGAVNSTGLDPATYLYVVDGVALPGRSPSPPFASVASGGGRTNQPAAAPDLGWPIGGALGQRIFCIEGIESRHGAAMYNPTPVSDGEHAQGFLGFLPSTARRYGVVIGNRASEWNGAAKMIQSGAGRQFAGIALGRC